MKNRAVNLLLAITILFVGITIGFSLGRNANHEAVQLSVLQTDGLKIVPEGTDATVLAEPPGTTETTAATAATGEAAVAAAAETQGSGPVNINTADHAALMTLPGIGEVLAQRIIDYRQANGNFGSLEELTNVQGIGEKRLEAILDYATVGG